MENIQANDMCTGYDRNSIHQIQKKDNDTTPTSKYNIFPLTYVQAVYDARDGRRLDTLLDQCNSVYVYWKGSAEKTRLALPMYMRRKGIIITYRNADDEVITEKSIYDDCIADDVWGLENHWVRITDALPITGNVTIGPNGNWFVNGEDTGFKAQGPKGEDGLPLIPRVSEDKTKIEYSYNNTDWYEMFPLSLITPNISFEEPVELEPGATPTVENVGDGFNVNLQFGLPKAPEVNVGFTTTIGEGNHAKVTNSGTPYSPVLNFQIPKGDTGRGITVKGFYPDLSTLQEKITSPAIGDVYCVGSAEPYTGYVWTNVYSSESQTAAPAWQSIGTINKDTTILVNELGNSETAAISQNTVTDNVYYLSASRFVEIQTPLTESEANVYLNLVTICFEDLPYQSNISVKSVTKNHETLGNQFVLNWIFDDNSNIEIGIRQEDNTEDLFNGKTFTKKFTTNVPNKGQVNYSLTIQFNKDALSNLENGTIFYSNENNNKLLPSCFKSGLYDINSLENNIQTQINYKYGFVDLQLSNLSKVKNVADYISSIKIKGIPDEYRGNKIGFYSLVFNHDTYGCRVGIRMVNEDGTYISSNIVQNNSFDNVFKLSFDNKVVEVKISIKNNPSNNWIAISETGEPWFIFDKYVFVDALDEDVEYNRKQIDNIFGNSNQDIFLNPKVVYTENEYRIMNSFKNLGFSNVPESVKTHQFIIRTFSASSTVNPPTTYGAQIIIADKNIYNDTQDWNQASVTLISQVPCDFGEYSVDVVATTGQLAGMRIKALIDFSEFKSIDGYLYPTSSTNRLYLNVNKTWKNNGLNDIITELLDNNSSSVISNNSWFPLESRNVAFIGSSNVWGDGFLFYSYLKEAVDYLYKSSGSYNSAQLLDIPNSTTINNNQKFLDGVSKKITGIGSEITFEHSGSELNICQVIERTSDYAVIGVYDGETKIAEFTNHNTTIGSNTESFTGDGSKTKFELSRCFTYNHSLTVNNSPVSVKLNTQGYGATFPEGTDALIIRGLNANGNVTHSIWFKTAPPSGASIQISYDYGETICFVKSTVGEDENGVNESPYGDGSISYDPVNPSGISSGLDFRLVNEKAFFRYWFDTDEKRTITLRIESGLNPYFIFNFSSSVFHNIMNAGIGGYTAEKFNTLENNPTTSWQNIADYFTPDFVSIGLTGNDDWNNFPRKISREMTMTLSELQSYPSLEIQKIVYNPESDNYTVTVNSGTISSITKTSLISDSIKSSSVSAGDFVRIGTYTGDLRQVQTRIIDTVDTSTGEITWSEPLHLNEYICVDSLNDLIGQDVSIRSIDNYTSNMKELITNIKKISPKCKVCLFNVYYVDMWNRNVAEYPYIQQWIANEFDDSVFVVDAWKYARDYCELSNKTSVSVTADGTAELSFTSPNGLGHIEGIEVWVNGENVYGKDCYLQTGWYYSVDSDLSGESLNWEGNNSYLRPQDNRTDPKIIWKKNIPTNNTNVIIKYAIKQWSSDYAHPNSGDYINNSLGRALVYALQK